MIRPPSNLRSIRDDDRRFVEGEVGFVELRKTRHVVVGAMPLRGPRLAVLRDRQISVYRRCRGAIAIAANDAPYVALVIFCIVYFGGRLLLAVLS